MIGLEVWRAVLIFAEGLVIVLLSFRYITSFNHLSLAQKLYNSAIVLFAIQALIATLQMFADGRGDQWSWNLLPGTIAILLLYAYVFEPRRGMRSRWGRDPFDPPPKGRNNQ